MSTLFAYAILSETLVNYFRTFTIMRSFGLPKAGLNSGVVFILSGFNSRILLYFSKKTCLVSTGIFARQFQEPTISAFIEK